jgi:crossover junction endodeoxyribonuclease RusA
VKILVNPPDRRRRDIDNLTKVPLDALTHAAVWEDDSQIDELYIRRNPVTPGGAITIQIHQLTE